MSHFFVVNSAQSYLVIKVGQPLSSVPVTMAVPPRHLAEAIEFVCVCFFLTLPIVIRRNSESGEQLPDELRQKAISLILPSLRQMAQGKFLSKERVGQAGQV